MIEFYERPLTPQERENNIQDVVATNSNTVAVFEPKQKLDLTKYTKESKFGFDRVFNERDTNLKVYGEVCEPLIDLFFDGSNITLFA